MTEVGKFDVFISYSRKNSTIVNEFVSLLEQNGFTIWLDKNGVESGDAFKQIIVRAIENSTCVLFFSSQESNLSSWTAKEIGVAVYEKKVIIPIKIDNSKYNSEIKFDLINLDYIDYTNVDFRAEMKKKLLTTLSSKCHKALHNPPMLNTVEESIPHVKEPSLRKNFTHLLRSTKLKMAFLISGIIIIAIYVYGKNFMFVKWGRENYAIAKMMLEKKDTMSAIPYLLKSMDYGNSTAMAEMGVCYFKGRGGLTKDSMMAYNLFEQSVEKGDAIGQYWLGDFYEHGHCVQKDSVKAFKLFEQSARNGYSLGMYRLAFCYIYGIGVKCDTLRAFNWAKQSAELGDGGGQNLLGWFYQYGHGVKLDTIEAIKWYKKSALQNELASIIKLADCYYSGSCVKKDENEAFRWYMKAADLNDSEGMYYVGKCYSEGKGVKLNEKEAIKWYLKSAQMGCEDAQYALGLFYNNRKDYVEAVKWYHKAAEQDNKDALLQLGQYYFNGLGVQPDTAKAVKYWEESLKPRSYGYFSIVITTSTATHNLGLCYENGWGVEKNLQKAKYWYNIERGIITDSTSVNKN